MEDKFFSVNTSKYVENTSFEVYRASSLDNPRNNSVMFIIPAFITRAEVFFTVSECLVFWPQSKEVPEGLEERHAVCKVADTHNAFARFFSENDIDNRPMPRPVQIVNGSYIEEGATIGENCTIFPGCYIGAEVVIGNNAYIGSGVKINGRVEIGNNVSIRENTVIGGESLTTDRDKDGSALTIPQFGRVIIEDDAWIGSCVCINRGAIDETRVCRGAKISCGSHVGHNTYIGEDSFLAANAVMLGRAWVGNRVLVAGNCTITNGVHVNDDAVVGDGSVVKYEVPAGARVFGNPAKQLITLGSRKKA